MAKPRTMYDKIWDDHVVETERRPRLSTSTAISSMK